MSVDLPEPLAPISATNSPRLISSDTPRTAGTSNSPVRYTLCTSTSLTSSPLFIVPTDVVVASLRDAHRRSCNHIRDCASHSEAATGWREQNVFSFPPHHGNLRPPENGFAGVDAGWGFVAISAVTTRSPSFNPSTTSVTTPSLIPVLIWTGFGCPRDKT